MRHRRFACARLPDPYMTRSQPRLLTMTFTTADFGRSSSWQFEASSCKAAPEGLPPSLAQARRLRVFLTQHHGASLCPPTTSSLSDWMTDEPHHHLDRKLRLHAL